MLELFTRAFYRQMKGLVMSCTFWSHLLIGEENDIKGGDIPYDVSKIIDRDAVRYVRLVEYLEKGITVSLRG